VFIETVKSIDDDAILITPVLAVLAYPAEGWLYRSDHAVSLIDNQFLNQPHSVPHPRQDLNFTNHLAVANYLTHNQYWKPGLIRGLPLLQVSFTCGYLPASW